MSCSDCVSVHTQAGAAAGSEQLYLVLSFADTIVCSLYFVVHSHLYFSKLTFTCSSRGCDFLYYFFWHERRHISVKRGVAHD